MDSFIHVRLGDKDERQFYACFGVFKFKCRLASFVCLVLQGGGNAHDGFILTHLGCGDENTLMGNVYGVDTRQPHMAVDARTGIPAAVLLSGVVHAHGHGVSTFLINIRSDVVVERRITIGVFSHQMSVDIHFGVHINALEVEAKAVADAVNLVQRKAFAIPADACGEVAAIVSCRFIGCSGSLDAPVVGQVQLPPRFVIEVRRCRLGMVAKGKSPSLVEQGLVVYSFI